MPPQKTDAELDAIHNQLQEMSERLEADITAAVRKVFEQSGYFYPANLDKLVMPAAAWASGLPWEAYEKGLVDLKKSR